MKKIYLLLSVLLFTTIFSSSVYASDFTDTQITVIIDAGHGGEDGGAVAKDGTLEKNLNLCITEKTKILFNLFGIRYITTRNTDKSVGNNKLKSIKERKISDIHTRYELINNTSNSVLLSIHMNKYPDSQYSGLQVFYAPKSNESEFLAQIIQNNTKQLMQPDNDRQIKATNGSVYLLDKAIRPSVLVECGFISNEKELELLKDKVYQAKISYLLTKSILAYRYENKKGYYGSQQNSIHL